jgi:transmembrane sensor
MALNSSDSLDWARESGSAARVLWEIELKLARKRRRRARWAAVAATVILIGGLGAWAVPIWLQTSTVVTAAAEPREVSLPDGTTVQLSAETALHADFRYGRRIVALARGEAFFAVAKDRSRPFRVETAHGTVQVTGTRFNVRLADQEPEVTLLEGSVTLERVGTHPWHLVPGQQFRFIESIATIRTLKPAELQAVTAWRRGELVLDRLTLAEAARRFADYDAVAIDLAPDIGALHLGGRCRLDDLPGFLSFVGKALSVDVLPKGRNHYVIQRR